MSDQPVIPLFDETVVRDALEHIRQATSPGKTPLRQLVWLHRRLEARRAQASGIGLDVALGEALNEIIEDNLRRLRQIEEIPFPAAMNRNLALQAMKADFLKANTELEAWSALYHRYILLDLSLQAQEMARILEIEPRQLRRRMEYGFRRLAETISAREMQARAENWRLWMRLNLPPAAYGALVGLEKTLSDLQSQIEADDPPHVLVISGPAGVGKTTLAHALAARLIDPAVSISGVDPGNGIGSSPFSDFVWVTLDAPIPYPALLGMLASSLGQPHLPGSEFPELEAGLRFRMSAGRPLVVIDNAEQLEDLSGLLPRLNDLAGAGWLVVMSRHRPSADTFHHLFQVQALTRADADKLTLTFAQQRRQKKPRQKVLDALYAATGGNPLAIRLAVGQMSYLPLDRILPQPGSPKGGEASPVLDRLFRETWGVLSDEAQQAAIGTLLLSDRPFTYEELLAASDLPAAMLDSAIRELVGCSILETSGPDPQYVMHPLARRFIEGQARLPEVAPVMQRLLAGAARRQESAEMPGMESALAALRWQGGTTAPLQFYVSLVERVAPLARRSGQWHSWRAGLLPLADRLRNESSPPPGLARVLIESGVAARWLGENAAAKAAFEESITLCGEAGDFVLQAEALAELATLLEAQGEDEQAQRAYERCTSAAQRHGEALLRRRALTGLASIALRRQRHEEAISLIARSREASPDEPPDGQTLSLLSMALTQAGDHNTAIRVGNEALMAFQQEGDLPRQARAHLRLGMACHAAGETDQSLSHLHQGLGIMRALGDALGTARILNNLGVIYLETQRFSEALSIWQDALSLQERIGDRVGLAHTWYNLADLQWKLGKPDSANHSLDAAGELAAELALAPLLASIKTHPARAAQPTG